MIIHLDEQGGVVPTDQLAIDQDAERAVLGAVLLLGDARRVTGLLTRGLRPADFYWPQHEEIFTACISLADRMAAIDTITVHAELERLGHRHKRDDIDNLCGYVPAAGHHGEYADRVMELSRWRERDTAIRDLRSAVMHRDPEKWASARENLETAKSGRRTESYSGDTWGALLFDYFAASPEEASKFAVSLPFPELTELLGGGLSPGEVCALSGPTSHGKSLLADQWIDHAAAKGKKCHLYMTEMTAIARGMRYLARRTGVPFLRQRRRMLTDNDRRLILAELGRIPYGVTVAADWTVDDIVRDALRARYDFVVVDLLHGFHYEDERGLDRLSKAMQRLARVSTTLDGHEGTAVVAVTHLKEEAQTKGKIPRPTISSIKGGSSIKQDADFVMFIWQEQEDGTPTGEAEAWFAKARSGNLGRCLLQLNQRRMRFDLRSGEAAAPAAATAAPAPAPVAEQAGMPF